MVLVLFESSLGYTLFRLSDGAALDKPESYKQDSSNLAKLLSLSAIQRFSSTAEGVEEISSIQEGKLSKTLKKFLVDEVQGKSSSKKGKKGEVNEQLVVSDPKLGGAIAKKLALNVVSDSTTQDLFRGIREQLAGLLSEEGVDEKDLSTMSLGLSHSLSRYKLKFSPDKVDTMIVQAIALLDDLDKEINIYAMRVKEWYGWHFPEMAKILSDNLAYAKVVKAMGLRTNAATTDFSTILPEDLEEVVKAAAVISMGTEISVTDLHHIHLLADQVISISNYRAELYSYLTNRMAAIAPNLTALVGELVGARLIAHAGSLMTLAKHPASTIQILGAEKALFRALKTKHDTPKYGLIFHASLVGQAPQKLKGKMARMVATKTALSCRIDALSDADTKSAEDAPIQGIENRSKLESRLRALEQGMGITNIRRQTAGAAMNKQPGKFEMRTNGAQYNAGADALIPSQTTPAAAAAPAPAANGVTNGSNGMEVDGDETADMSIKKKEKKDKKRKRDAAQEFADEAADVSLAAPAETADEADKKEKKKRKKEAKLAAKAGELERVAAAEIGDVSLATTLAGDTTKADESTLDDDEKKRLKAEKKAAKKAKKAAAA